MPKSLKSWAMPLGIVTAAALLAVGLTSFAQTPLSQVCFSPDITVNLSGTTLGPDQVGCDNLAGTVTAHTFPGIQPGVHVTGYLPLNSTQTLLTFNVTATLPTNGTGGIITVSPRDVTEFNPSSGFFSAALFFQGSLNGVPDGSRIRSLSIDSSSNLLLAFDDTTALPGPGGSTVTAKPADVLKLTGASQPFSLFFDSAATGIPNGAKVTGASLLDNGDLLLSFDISGSIAGVNFDNNDAVEFAPPSSGTAWSVVGIAYKGVTQHPGWPPGEIRGLYAKAAATATATPSFTPTVTPTPSPTATASTTPTATASTTPTPTATATATATATPTTTATATATASATSTATATSTPTATATASSTPTPTPTPGCEQPDDASACKKGGWRKFCGPTFRNQGQCVSFVERNKHKSR